MGEVAIAVFKWIIKGSILLSVLVSFSGLFIIVFSMINIHLNQSIINDLLALFQMWMPFDIDVIISWAFTTSFIYVGYRLIIFTFNIVNRFLR